MHVCVQPENKVMVTGQSGHRERSFLCACDKFKVKVSLQLGQGGPWQQSILMVEGNLSQGDS